MDGVSDTYHVPFGVALHGQLDVDALRGALDRVVARHEALRTTFALIDEVPVQRIAPAHEAHFGVREDDLRAVPIAAALRATSRPRRTRRSIWPPVR